MQAHICTHKHSQTLTNTHTHFISLSICFSLFLSLFLSLSHTHAHINAQYACACICTSSFNHSFIHSHLYTFTRIDALLGTQIHTVVCFDDSGRKADGRFLLHALRYIRNLINFRPNRIFPVRFDSQAVVNCEPLQ